MGHNGQNLLIFFLSFIFFTVTAQEKTEVLLLGTYHFGGSTSDSIKVTNDNILSIKTQKELEVLLSKLEEFKPEKIYVENEHHQQMFWDSIYIEHKNGKELTIKNELYQIGIKLAARLNLKAGITCVDWQIKPEETFAEKEYGKFLESMNNYYSSNYDTIPEIQSEYEEKILQEIKTFNTRIPSLELIDVFRTLNSKSYLDKMFYGNISSLLDIDQHKMNIVWSQNNMIRNVNIYQNIIQDILKNKPMRVLILYGAGHIKALKDYLDAHPAVRIIETTNIL